MLIPWQELRVCRGEQWLRGVHRRRYLTNWRAGEALPGTVCTSGDIPVVPSQVEWAHFIPAAPRKGGRPGKTNKTVVLSIRLEREVLDAMPQHMRAKETRSQFIRRAVRAFLNL